MDPEKVLKRKTGRPKLRNMLTPLEARQFRLSPLDAVLEKEVNIH